MPKARPIVLREILDIAAAGALRDEVSAALSGRKALAVDGASVRKLSTPCVQVLIAAGMEAERQGKPFTLEVISPAFTDAFNSLGFSEYLDRWKNK